MPEGRGDAGQAVLVKQAALPDAPQPRRDGVQRLVPRDRHETRVLIAALLGVGALHRRQHAMGVVGLLHEAQSLDADAPHARMYLFSGVIGIDAGGDAVLNPHGHEIGPATQL